MRNFRLSFLLMLLTTSIPAGVSIAVIWSALGNQFGEFLARTSTSLLIYAVLFGFFGVVYGLTYLRLTLLTIGLEGIESSNLSKIPAAAVVAGFTLLSSLLCASVVFFVIEINEAILRLIGIIAVISSGGTVTILVTFVFANIAHFIVKHQ